MSGYGETLWWVIRHRVVVGLVTIATIVLTIVSCTHRAVGLFPQQDTGMLMGSSPGRRTSRSLR